MKVEFEARAQFRRRAGLTLFDLGRLVGKSPGTLSLWERGQIELSHEDVSKIANVIETEFNRVPLPETREGIAHVLAGAAA